MSIQNYNFNSSLGFGNNVSFRGEEQSKIPIITKPIDKVESIVNNTVDTFVPEPASEEKKKSHKTAIRVGSTVLVLSAFVALLNPKISSSLVNKLKTKSTKAGNKAKVDNSLWGAWNKIKEKFFQGVTNAFQTISNVNSFKDEVFQKICSKTSVTKKTHKAITKGFEKISRRTVYGKYKDVTKRMNMLDGIMNNYKDRLSSTERKLLEDKLREIDTIQKYYAPEQVSKRLDNQETLMANLEKEVYGKIKSAASTVAGKFRGKTTPEDMKFRDVYSSFWAENALKEQRTKIEEDGLKVVNSLVGDGHTQKGCYREVLDILAPKLKEEEKSAVEESIKKVEKHLRKANRSECTEFFDKKRDLMLGSAPTDVLTALFGLTASGVAIGVADSKEDRISRAVTKAFPVVAGLGVSTALTALLFSGGKGIVLGAASSMILSIIGSSVNRMIFPKSRQIDNTAENKTNKESEVINA